MKNYLAFDIGGTTIKHAIVDDKGKITERNAFETMDDAQKIVDQMISVFEKSNSTQKIEGIGISTPGIIRKDGYQVTGGAIGSLYNFPLGKTIAEKSGLEVQVENDANAAAIAEHWIGNAIGCDNYLTIVLGTGVGGGIVLNGDVYRGAHGVAGEFGWNIIHDPDFTRELENYSLNFHAAVVLGLIRRYQKNLAQIGISEKSKDAKQILDLAQNNDPLAQKSVNDFIQDISIMLLNLFATFDPELILIGGGISANDYFMDLLNQKFTEYCRRHGSINRIKDQSLGAIKPAKLLNDAGLVGAAYRIKTYLEKKHL